MRRVKRQRQVHQAAIGLEVDEKPMWYFTSPVPRCSLCLRRTRRTSLAVFYPARSPARSTTTVRHPENHFAGAAVASVAIISLSIGINASPPSSEKRFGQGILRRGNVQGLQRRSVRLEAFFLFAIESRATRLDTLLDQRFSSVLVMCIYSAPIGPQWFA